MNALPTFDEFRAQVLSRGCDEVLERQWAPGTVLQEHTHPFAADALVVQGEMWLSHDGSERRLGPGDRFKLQTLQPHAERYGPQGATYWVGRSR